MLLCTGMLPDYVDCDNDDGNTEELLVAREKE